MAEFVTICPAEEIPQGAREVFSVNDRWIAIFNVSGKFYAIEDVCTHDGNTLTEDYDGTQVPLEDHTIKCPRHGAVFDIRNGDFLRGPAGTVDVPWFEVRVQDGNIQLKIG